VSDSATVSQRGAQRWERGHPWIFRSDVRKRPGASAGVVRVRDDRGRWLGLALWSPSSEISLRLIDVETDATIDADWWERRLAKSIARRASLGEIATAYRLVHAEGDGLPSLICDRYDRWLVVQILSAGLEVYRDAIVDALVRLTSAEGVLARNDVPLRSREELPRETALLHGDVPREVIVREREVRYAAAPWTGQKTGAFLDSSRSASARSRAGDGRALPVVQSTDNVRRT
jgi:23S rRNA (cytosine1962-C5)-methyltransferase